MLDPSLQDLIFRLHLFSTLFMAGVIWYVQVVHYPILRLFTSEAAEAVTRFHQRRTGWVVAPVMLIELLTATLLLRSTWMMLFGHYLWANLIVLLLIWGITFLRLLPLHKRLRSEFDNATLKSLFTANCIPAILWSIRSLLLLNFLG